MLIDHDIQRDSPRPDSAQSRSTTAERFEVKYLITESLALGICDYIAPYVQADPHLDGTKAYGLTSLYYDNARLATYWSSECGEKNRYKIRVRRYGTDGGLYLEIKRRVGQVVRKQRARISESDAEALLHRNASPLSMADRISPEKRDTYHAFTDLVDRIGATPRVLVRYSREAYVSALEEPVRLTFDRQLCCVPCCTYRSDIWRDECLWYEVGDYPLIFELKFTNVFPGWVRRMVERFELRQRSVAKYVLCVKSLNRHGIVIGGSGLGSPGHAVSEGAPLRS